MASSCFLFRPPHLFFFLIFLFVPFLSLGQQISVDVNSSVWEFPSNPLCLSQQRNFAESQFSKNLNSLVSSIPSLKSNTYNFYSLYVGSISDQERVEAIGICNRVVNRVDCLNCIAQAAVNLTTIYCPQHRQAYVRATKCMFRYSDKPIFGKLETSPPLEAPNPSNATGDRNEFIRLQSELLNRLRSEAASGGSKRKYAQGTDPGSPPYTTFFGAAQCTPDLSEKDCNDCLSYGFGNATKGRVGIRWFCPSCNFQIESDLRFFLLDSEYEPDPKPGNGKVKIIIATVCSVIGFAIIAVFLYIFMTRNRRTAKQRHEGKDLEELMIKDAQLLQLDFDTIRLATNDFSRDNQLGEGGFGAVYKGVLDYGEEIAVKRLSMKSGQGDNEFINEVSLVAKLQHRNLVRLLGFCLQGEERILIYEFFKNTSLDHYIFEEDSSLFLLSYVWKSWREGEVLNIVDPSLVETIGVSDEIMKCIHIGLLCVQDNAESRPTMASVVVMLNANSFTLPRPSQPAFYTGDGESILRYTNQINHIASLNDVTITEFDAR
ncbi:unnamed protein product [Arabidopsis thaliana]|uniref:(thale cress) hypothetical protein n=1 Tax=Arabidopsis thaliana TaxID=3702 RepID=A0A7G2EXI8_ARATH|nr:unnamed protein product [Arabidopsis thaliana]